MPRYQRLKLYTVTKGEYGASDSETFVKTFKGVIQQRSVTGFDKGKMKSAIVPTLIYDLGQITIDTSKNYLVKDTDGTPYIITEPHQPNGVSGIKPTSFKNKVIMTLEKVV